MLRFKCPQCSSERLEEVMTDVTVASMIDGVEELSGDIGEDNLLDVHYGDATNDGGEVACYQCVDCGTVLKDATGTTIDDLPELRDWLLAHGAQQAQVSSK